MIKYSMKSHGEILKHWGIGLPLDLCCSPLQCNLSEIKTHKILFLTIKSPNGILYGDIIEFNL